MRRRWRNGSAAIRNAARRGGSSVAELRRILSPECAAGIDTGLVIERERDGVPWQLQTGERSTMQYAVHLALLRRAAPAVAA